MKRYPRLLNGIEWLLIGGMLLILFAPIAGKLSGWPQEIDLKENRLLAQPPSVRETPWDGMSHAIDKWWNDRFAFRTQLIPLRESIWLDLLSAPGKQFVRGKDGHLFLNLMPGETFHGSQNDTVLDYLGVNRLTEKQLSDWADYLEGKSAWLQANGVHYLFVISPNKITVQERFLPNLIRMAKGKSYLEQLREQVFPRLTQDVDLLDLTGVLIAKETETGKPMFSRTGDVTHWNAMGFFEGQVAMDARLRRHFPDMPPFPKDNIEITAVDSDDSPINVTVPQTPTCTATLDGNSLLHIPYLSYIHPTSGTQFLWADFVYEFDPKYPTKILFKYINSGVISNPSNSCTAVTLSDTLNIHIPDVLLQDGNTHVSADLELYPDLSTDGNTYFTATYHLKKSVNDPAAFSCRWKIDPTVHAVDETIIAYRSSGWDSPKCSMAEGRKGNLSLFSDSSWKAFCGGLDAFFPGTHTAFPYQWGHHRHANLYHVTFNELKRMVQEDKPDAVVEAQTERALVIPPGIGIPAEFRLAARFARGTTIFLLTINDLTALFGVNIDGIAIDGDAVVLNATNDDPAIGTSQSVQLSKNSESVMLIDLDVPAAGTFQVFWSINNAFSENNSTKVDLEKGRNVIFLPILLPADENIQLRIDPGTVAGKYRIRKIELRATPLNNQQSF